MRVFTIHYRPALSAPDVAIVKEGFSWPALVFSAPWALWHGMWGVFLVLLAAGAALELAVGLAGADPATGLAAGLGYGAFVGFNANDWRRRNLRRHGYRTAGIVAARDRDSALRRFFDLNPEALGGPPGAAIGAL